MNSRLIGYDHNLEMDYQIAAERFCSIANKQVIPLFESLELELNEKDIKAAVTNRQIAKDLYSAIIGETTPKKDKGILRRLLLNTASSDFDALVAKYGRNTTAYNYYCIYNADTKRMEIDSEKIHKAAAIVIEGDMLALYERVEAMANAINAVCGTVATKYELDLIIKTLDLDLETQKVVPATNLSRYEYVIESLNANLLAK
jgi:hypothetical protein